MELNNPPVVERRYVGQLMALIRDPSFIPDFEVGVWLWSRGYVRRTIGGIATAGNLAVTAHGMQWLNALT